MAEEEQAGKGLAALGHKIGPFPAAVWAGLLIGAYYVLRKRKSSSSTSAGQTDPAGNVGTIDPATGYVYGSPEDQAALASNNTASGTSSSSGSGSTAGGQYTTNADWGRAAINLLVSLGVDPTEANTAITQYLASQTLTTNQQADVNLAIQTLGAPPDPPQPGGSPPPVVTPPGGGNPVYATNPPTGLSTWGSSPQTITLRWNKASNATGYTINYGPANSSAWPTNSTTSPAGATGITIGRLSPNTTYRFAVQATPAQAGAGSASITATTPKGAITTNPTPAATGTPAATTTRTGTASTARKAT